MIDNAALSTILASADDISVVCEIYSADTLPGDDGLDPANAIDCFAAIDGITFRGRSYRRLVKSFGRVSRGITGKIDTTSVTFSNVTREMSEFEFTYGFEGLILCVRLLSRGQSVALTDSQILFTGRCEKPDSGNKEQLPVKAKFILGGLDPVIPRRKFGPEDHEGRPSTHPEFEGFINMPQEGTTSYSVRERKRNPWGLALGIVGFFFLKKTRTVTKTLHWSSFSDLDANKSVPEIFGRAQILGTHIGYADVGAEIRLRTAYCEGEIYDYVTIKILDSRLTFNPGAYYESFGRVGALNGDDPTWIAPGNYSRTANIRMGLNNSTIDTVDAAPDIAAIILGRIMKTPDDAGVWNTDAWTNNAAAHARFLLTSPDYFKLNEGWIDDADAAECFNYNDELIFNAGVSDFMFIDEG